MENKFRRRIALLELNNYHSEILYSQICFLKEADCQITLIIDWKLKEAVKDLGVNVETVLFDFSKISSFLKLRTYIIKNKFDTVILDTAQGDRALKFSLLPFSKKITFVGIIHNSLKLESSRGQRFISNRFRKLFTLGKYVLLPEKASRYIETTYFNPCYFPRYETENMNKSDDIWIGIPGNIALHKRDFDFLIELASNERLKENVKFLLLGNIDKSDGPQMKSMLIESGLLDRFVLFEGFIPYSIYHAYVKSSDYLLPLIHPETSKAKPFFKNQVSGTFILSAAYGITMLSHFKFSEVKNFDYSAVFYKSVDECVDLINNHIKSDKSYVFNYKEDRDRYIDFLGLKKCINS